MSPRPRDPAKVDLARQLRGQGLTLEAISERIGVAPNTVGDYVGKTDRGGTPWTDAKVKFLKEAWLAGGSGTTVARQLGAGFTRCSVIAKVHRLGLTRSAAIAASNLPRGNLHHRTRPAKPISRAAAVKPAPKSGDIPVARSAPLPGPMSTELAASRIGDNAKPFGEQGRGECAWPIDLPGGALLACCEPVIGKGWCVEHFRRGTIRTQPVAINEPLLRRFA